MWQRRPPPPAWPDEEPPRPRIVIENVDATQQWLEERILRDAGYDVVACGGPQSLRRACPLLVDADCPAIVAADAVVSSLRVETPEGRDVIAGIRRRHPGVPLIVEAAPAAARAHGDVLGGCEVVFPLTAGSLVEAVKRALARRGAALG